MTLRGRRFLGETIEGRWSRERDWVAVRRVWIAMRLLVSTSNSMGLILEARSSLFLFLFGSVAYGKR